MLPSLSTALRIFPPTSWARNGKGRAENILRRGEVCDEESVDCFPESGDSRRMCGVPDVCGGLWAGREVIGAR